MNLRETLSAAVDAISRDGFISTAQLQYWEQRIKAAAEREMGASSADIQRVNEMLTAIYKRQVDNGALLKVNPGVSRFTIENLKPKLRPELDKRIMASANLIRLNKAASVEKTLQRFSGWATSIPAGGSKAVDKREEKAHINKALSSLPFESRRVAIDQGHKLVASINEVVARDQNAIGLIWRSRWRQPGYNYRVDHKERDGHFYMIRGNWAQERGLVKVGPDGYYDDITHVAEEPFCRCSAQYIYNLRSVPDECITVKGREELAAVRRRLVA